MTDSKHDYLASKRNATVFDLLLFLCRSSCTHVEQLRYLGLGVLLLTMRAAPDGNMWWIRRRSNSRQRIDWRSQPITTV